MNQVDYLRLRGYFAFSKRVIDSDKFEWYEKGFILDGIVFTVEDLCGVVLDRQNPSHEDKLTQWFESFQTMMKKLESIAPFPE